MENNKIKPIIIGGIIGSLAGANVALSMGKKDIKNIAIFTGIGVAIGAAVCYFIFKDEEEKSNAAGNDPSCCNRTTKRCCRIVTPQM